jgi:hypothetical protein
MPASRTQFHLAVADSPTPVRRGRRGLDPSTRVLD